MQDNDHILTTSIDGIIQIYSIKQQKRVFIHDTLPHIRQETIDFEEKALTPESKKKVDYKTINMMATNIMHSCFVMKAEGESHNHYLVGNENG